MFPDTSKGAINLVAQVYILGEYRECFVLEARARSQMAKVQIKGTLFPALVLFHQIANVSLKYDNGEILHTFGAPRVSNPESIEYASDWREALV